VSCRDVTQQVKFGRILRRDFAHFVNAQFADKPTDGRSIRGLVVSRKC